jgi:CxxC motif-containing protein (DUF1111 family)
VTLLTVLTLADTAPEAVTGFDLLTNGMVDQATHDADREEFEGQDTIAEGLGPLYNATSCVDCHQNPVTGGSSQINEMRAGHLENGQFVNPQGGSSLIHDRAVDPQIQQRIPGTEFIHAFRASTSILGLGFVEAVDDQTLLDLANKQAALSGGRIRGQAIMVDVFEAPGVKRVGRFGWKDQQASLLSFSADADLNEKGITNRFLPDESLYFGQSVAAFDHADNHPNDVNQDIDAYARYMRATKAPPRGVIGADAQAGEAVFQKVGCGICHTATLQTVAAGTQLNGGTYTVPDAIGGKTFHPFSDFLLHDVGTGDGIVQNGGPSTRNKLRTPPLWGLRSRGRFMHDGSAPDLTTAIRRHDNEAQSARFRYFFLGRTDTKNLIAFLNSL